MNKVLDEIIDLMKRAGTRPMETGVPGLSMIKGDIPTHQLAALYKPMIGFTVQGTKILSIGERSTIMEGPSYYVLPVHVPATAVHSDCDGRPYMSLGLELNQNVLQSLLRDLPENLIPTASEDFFAACEIDIEFMEAWLREGYAAASAAYQVGYQSPSQFKREYSRFFGSSPARDTEKLRLIERARDNLQLSIN